MSLAGETQKFRYLDTPAAAHAEAGRFTDAVATQTKAIAMIPRDYDVQEAVQFKVRFQAYKDNKRGINLNPDHAAAQRAMNFGYGK